MDDQRNFLIPGAIVVAGVIIAGAVLYIGGFGSRRAPPSPPPPGSGTVVAGDMAADGPSLGDPKAPVTFVEFGDFQCPFCNRFFHDVEPVIIERYVKTGKVRFVYRDFAFLGDESVAAAEAARCANDQGKFWPYHDKLYASIWDTYFSQGKNGENVGAFSAANLKRFAAELGLDAARFSTCLAERRFQAAVQKDTADGRSAGVNGTPATFINGKLTVGALPVGDFMRLIDEALAGK